MKQFRNFIIWLEDQKIKHNNIEDRGNLRNIHSYDWPSSLKSISKMLIVLFKIQDGQVAIDWLLGLAWFRFEYGDNAEKYKDFVPDNTKKMLTTVTKNAEPLSIWM